MNSNSGRPNNYWIVLIPVILSMLPACYQRQEGCLDITAVNFDVEADRPCADCCEYPNLTLEFQHRVILPDTELVFQYDSLYYLENQPDVFFRFRRIRFYVSNLEFRNANSVATLSDSLEMLVPDGMGDSLEVRIPDNVMLVDKEQFSSRELGSFRGSGFFDQIRFWVGVGPLVQQADPNTAPEGHPLRIQPDSLNWSAGEGYIAANLILLRDPGSEDSTQVKLIDPQLVVLPLNPPVEIKPGFDLRLRLRINYLAWLEGLNLATASEAEIAQQIAQQIANGFYSAEIILE